MTIFRRPARAVCGVACMLAGCGGGPSKPAASASRCPEGTAQSGSDCVPTESTESVGSANASQNAAQSGEPSAAEQAASGDSTRGGASSDSAEPTGAPAGPPYDKDAVEAELRRGARQVKANCGAATDEDGQANGPWGKTKVSIVLGRNGHVRSVSVPEPYSGKPVGTCMADAFKRIQFPPYAAPGDVTVDWDVDIVAPKH